MDIKRTHGAANHHGCGRHSRCAHWHGTCRGGTVGNLDSALDDDVAVMRLHRSHVGLVDPGELAIGTPQPDGQRRGIEDSAQAFHLFAELVGIIGESRHIAPLARQRPEPQGCKAASRAAIGLEQFALRVRMPMLKGSPVLRSAAATATPIQGQSRIPFQPLAEIQQRLGRLGQMRRTMHGTGDAFRRVATSTPDDEHVGFEGDRRFGVQAVSRSAMRRRSGRSRPSTCGALHRWPRRRRR